MGRGYRHLSVASDRGGELPQNKLERLERTLTDLVKFVTRSEIYKGPSFHTILGY